MWQVKKKFMWFIRFAVFCVHEYCFHAYILKNNCTASFFILFSAKYSLLFMINSISCFKYSSTTFGQSKLKQKVLGSLIKIMFSSMIVMAWLNCCKPFWWFYHADTKDIVFVSFDFLIYINCFHLLFVLIILEV